MQLSSRTVYLGRVIGLDVDTVRYPDGSTGELEMIRHPGAAAVVPVASDPRGDNPTLLLIKQYRYATGGTLWEIPAGRLAPGEDPADCARRELLEEVGVTAGRVEPLTTIWTTPGVRERASRGRRRPCRECRIRGRLHAAPAAHRTRAPGPASAVPAR